MAQELNARMMRAALTFLRDRGDPTPRPKVIEAVKQGAIVGTDDANDDTSPPRWQRTFGWLVTQAVGVGWIVRVEDGVWQATEAGSVALETFEGVELARELGRLNRRRRRASTSATSGFVDPRWAVVSSAVSLLGPGDWTSYGELADLTGLSAQSIGRYIAEGHVDDGHRVLQADGSVSDQFRWTTPGRSETAREVLQAEGLSFDAAGRADAGRRITAAEFRDVLGADADTPSLRAWLIRGASVDGHDLVPIWLQKQSVSLSASKLRPIDPPMPRGELESFVEEDYAHKPYVAREAKTEEFDAFANRIKVGDLVMTTTQGKVYVGRVTGDAAFVSSSDGRSNLRRSVEWLNTDTPVAFVQLPKPLPAQFQNQSDVVDLTEQLAAVERLIESLTRTAAPVEEPPELVFRPVTDELADDLLTDAPWLQRQIDLLWDRRQIVLYGPPGTGKTFLARRLAEHLTEPSAVSLVQFHPSYSYEDFFEGFRPADGKDGSLRFERRPGPFRLLVESARDNPSQPHILIIDEINRANLAKVFGELYFLLEYRDAQIRLLYSPEEQFTLPDNVFVIGTMNTADRSIALVDSAMRRRFGFVELHPDSGPTRDLLPRWLARLQADEPVEHALDTPALLDVLNRGIERDLRLGPSYFMRPEIYRKADGLERTWTSAILPLLQEYYVDDPAAVEQFRLDAIRAQIADETVG